MITTSEDIKKKDNNDTEHIKSSRKLTPARQCNHVKRTRVNKSREISLHLNSSLKICETISSIISTFNVIKKIAYF